MKGAVVLVATERSELATMRSEHETTFEATCETTCETTFETTEGSLGTSER